MIKLIMMMTFSMFHESSLLGHTHHRHLRPDWKIDQWSGLEYNLSSDLSDWLAILVVFNLLLIALVSKIHRHSTRIRGQIAGEWRKKELDRFRYENFASRRKTLQVGCFRLGLHKLSAQHFTRYWYPFIIVI